MTGTPAAPVKLVTQAEYARSRRVSKAAVTKALKEGRIQLVAGLIDPVIADVQWAMNTRPRVDSGPSFCSGVAADPSKYASSRIARERAEAALTEIRVLEARGILVHRDRIRAELARALSTTRDALLNLPARLACVLAHERDEQAIGRLLTAEIEVAVAVTAGGLCKPSR